MTLGESLRSLGEGENNRGLKSVVIVRDQAPGEYILPKGRLFEALTQFCDDNKGLSVTAIRDDSSIPGGVAIHTQERKGPGVRARVVILNSSDSRSGVTATYPLGEDQILAAVETRR